MTFKPTTLLEIGTIVINILTQQESRSNSTGHNVRAIELIKDYETLVSNQQASTAIIKNGRRLSYNYY